MVSIALAKNLEDYKLAEESESEFEKDLKKLIRGLVAICPAYNSATRTLRDLRGKSIVDVSVSYPEIFNPKLLPLLTSLFGFTATIQTNIDSGSVGYGLLSLLDTFEKELDKDDMRKLIGLSLDEEPPNPIKDYVEACVKTLEESDPTALRLLRVASSEHSMRFDTLIQQVKEQFGLDVDREKLIERLKKLDNLGLLEYLRKDDLCVKVQFMRHVIDLARI